MNKRLLALFLPMVFAACQQQHVVNSPCSTVNASFDIKPRTDLSLVFGNDAIRAAIDAIKGGLSQGMPVQELSNSGKDVAVRAAKANGNNPTANDVSAFQEYLSHDIIPAMEQHPTCTFTVTSVGRPYIGVERVTITDLGGQRVPAVVVKNTGQAEVNSHVLVRYLIDGLEKSRAQFDIRLGPNQGRTTWPKDHNLPISDIEAGKNKLRMLIIVSYPMESGAPPVSYQEIWEYNPQARAFTLSY